MRVGTLGRDASGRSSGPNFRKGGEYICTGSVVERG